MIRVALSGASGRMGKELQSLIEEDCAFNWAYGFAESKQGEKIFSDLSFWKADEIDVVVDFSLPESFEKVYAWCSEHKKPLVSGTTGMDLENYREPGFPFLHSGNFSLGIAALIKSIAAFKVLESPNLKIWIEDYHHSKKLDAPSGTAIKIQKEIGAFFSDKIEIHSQRAGSILGVHKIHLVTDQEWLTLSHEALKRSVFAQGALNSAGWTLAQKPAFYSLEDYINSKNH